MMKEFKNGFGLFYLNAKKLAICIYTLRGKRGMKGLLNFGAISFLNPASKLTLKWHGNTRTIKLSHSSIHIFPRCHPDFYKTGHNWICEQIYYSVFHGKRQITLIPPQRYEKVAT